MVRLPGLIDDGPEASSVVGDDVPFLLAHGRLVDQRLAHADGDGASLDVLGSGLEVHVAGRHELTCGNGPRRSAKYPGVATLPGKSFRTSAPADHACMISVGVRQPGTTITP